MRSLIIAAFCILAAPVAAAPSPGWRLADTYPDTGGRAPVAHGGKVLGSIETIEG